MTSQKINYEYINLIKEPIFLCLAGFVKKRKVFTSKQRTLIVNPSAIGDFIAFLPALHTFLTKNNIETDLIVSSPVKSLAERVKGVRDVYIAKSIHQRDIEQDKKGQQFPEYTLVYVVRSSRAVYQLLKNIPAQHIKTSFIPYIKYSLHLIKASLLRKKSKQWREVNFEIFGENVKNVSFEDIFNFTKEDYRKARKLMPINKKKKEAIVIIHTGSGWRMKMWENDRWIELLKRINELGIFKFIFVGGSEEKRDFRFISSKLPFKVYSLINKANLRDIMLVMRMSNYFIGIDSGPRNMAHLADLRSVSILGPGPHMFMPLSKKDIVLDKSDLGGVYERFFYKKETLIKKITVNEAIVAFRKLLKKKTRHH